MASDTPPHSNGSSPSEPSHPVSFDAMPRKKRDRFHQVLQIMAEQQQDPDPKRRWISAPELMKLFGVKIRTIYRLMDALRDDHKLPIDFVTERGGWGYIEPVTTLPTVVYTRLETMALCFFMGIMRVFQDTIFAKPARTMIQKLTAGFCKELALEFDAIARCLSFHYTGSERHIDPAIFTTILPALVHHHELEIDYEKGPSLAANLTLSPALALAPFPSPEVSAQFRTAALEKREGASGHRRIEPLHLACIDHGWYLFAWDPAQNDIRQFALRRIRSIRATGTTCEPRDFDIEAELYDSFGAFRSGSSADANPETVRLRFWGRAASIVPEFTWHHSQQFTPVNPAGDTAVPQALEMTMQLAINPKLVGWIKQWLGEVVILEPASLRDDVRADALKAIADLDQVDPA